MNSLRFKGSSCLLIAALAVWGTGAVSAQVCDDTTRSNYATDVNNGFTQSQLESKYGHCRTLTPAGSFSEDEHSGYSNIAMAIKQGLNANTAWERMNGCGYHPQAEQASCDVEIRLNGGYGGFPGGTFEHVRFCFDCDQNGTWDFQTLGFVHVTDSILGAVGTPSWFHEAHATTFAAPPACTTNNGGQMRMRTILSWAALPPLCANGTSLVAAPFQPMPVFGNAFDVTARRDP